MAPNYGEATFKRRALLGLLPDPDDSTSTRTAATTAAAAAADDETTTTRGGGLLGGLSSAFGSVTSVAVGGVTSALGNIGPAFSSSTISSTSSITSTSVATSSSISSITTTSSTTSSSVSTSEAPTTSPIPSTPEPVSQNEATTTYLSTSGNQVLTITETHQVTSLAETETASVAGGGGTQSGFLQNKPLSGTIFAFVGLIGLAMLILVSTWFLRRSRRNRLEREAEAFSDAWPSTDTNEKRDAALTRSPSDRSYTGSDQVLIGGGNGGGGGGGGYGYGAADRMNDGSIQHGLPSPPPQMHPSSQMQQNAYGMGMGGGMNMNLGGAFNPLPAPPARTSPPPQMQMQPYGGGGGGYESPYAAYQQPAYMPPQAHQQQANLQRAPTNGGAWSNTPSPVTHQGPPSIFGQGHGRSSSGSGSGSGTFGQRAPPPPQPQQQQQQAEQGRNGVRASTGSDAYADYAYATGPGQQNSREPRNLTIANA